MLRSSNAREPPRIEPEADMANTYLTEAGAPDRCLIAPHLALGSFLRAMKKSRNITLAAMTRIGPFARLTNSATPWRSVSLRDVTV
jgi:hypothetical protein